MWRRRPIGRKLNDRFAPPQAVKLKTRKKSERYWRDRRITDKYRFAGRVLSCYHTANVHQTSRLVYQPDRFA